MKSGSSFVNKKNGNFFDVLKLSSEIAETTRESIAVLDNDHKILTTNKVFCDTFKIKQKEIENKIFDEILPFKNLKSEFLNKIFLPFQQDEKVIKDFHFTLTIDEKIKNFILNAKIIEKLYMNKKNCVLFTIEEITEVVEKEKEKSSLKKKLAETGSKLIQTEKEKNEMEEMLRHADRLSLIGQIAAGVAHELNDPLTAILGFAELIKKDSNLSKSAKADIINIIEAAIISRKIVGSFLSFCKKEISALKTLSINDVIRDGLFLIKNRCQYSNIDLKLYLNENVPEFKMKKIQILQVFMNITSNAIKAMPEGGELSIKTFSSKGLVFLVIEDTGIGIQKHMIKHIFDPFFTTGRYKSGNGLGLSIVKEIIKNHRGGIKVTSEINKGTRIIIHFPINHDCGE